MDKQVGLEEEMKRDICETMAAMYRRGLISATGGNVSAKNPGEKEFWITTHGFFKGDLSTDDLVKIDMDGRIVGGAENPSIEVPMHRAIYRLRPDVNAIVHAHNPIATGLALAGIEIRPVTVEAAFALGKVPVVRFALPGTEDLAKAVSRHLTGAKVLILQNHGVVGVGANLIEAQAMVEKLEEVAVTQWVAHTLGKPLPIPKRYLGLAKTC